jgi:hypothetical protein
MYTCKIIICKISFYSHIFKRADQKINTFIKEIISMNSFKKLHKITGWYSHVNFLEPPKRAPPAGDQAFNIWAFGEGHFAFKAYVLYVDWIYGSMRNNCTRINANFTLFFGLWFFFFLGVEGGAFSSAVWTQGLHLEQLHQPFFVMGFFKIRSHKLLSHIGFKPRSSWSLPPE